MRGWQGRSSRFLRSQMLVLKIFLLSKNIIRRPTEDSRPESPSLSLVQSSMLDSQSLVYENGKSHDDQTNQNRTTMIWRWMVQATNGWMDGFLDGTNNQPRRKSRKIRATHVLETKFFGNNTKRLEDGIPLFGPWCAWWRNPSVWPTPRGRCAFI